MLGIEGGLRVPFGHCSTPSNRGLRAGRGDAQDWRRAVWQMFEGAFSAQRLASLRCCASSKSVKSSSGCAQVAANRPVPHWPCIAFSILVLIGSRSARQDWARLAEISAIAARRGANGFHLFGARCQVWQHTFMAATIWPEAALMGTASEQTPRSNSSLRQYPYRARRRWRW